MPSILAICSGKGGVGKSTISFCLAKLLQQFNYKVGLIDADICGPSLHLFFENINGLKPENSNNKIIPPCIEGIYFMSAAFYCPGGAFVRAPKANALVKSFFENVIWPELDLIIVDFPPGTADIALTLCQEVAFDGAFVVTTPHTLSVEDASKSCKMMIEASVPILGVIENMAYFEEGMSKIYIFGKGGGQELKGLFDISALVTVPLYGQEEGGFFNKVVTQLASCKKIVDKHVLNKSVCTR